MPLVKNNKIYRKTFEMHCKSIRIILWTLVLLLTWSASGSFQHTGVLNPAGVSEVRAETPTSTDDTELQWFKDQMGISEKYMEDHEGLWGMSWPHFFTMVFLVLIALAGLAVFIQRQKKTREIMEIIQKEIKDGSSG